MRGIHFTRESQTGINWKVVRIERSPEAKKAAERFQLVDENDYAFGFCNTKEELGLFLNWKQQHQRWREEREKKAG